MPVLDDASDDNMSVAKFAGCILEIVSASLNVRSGILTEIETYNADTTLVLCMPTLLRALQESGDFVGLDEIVRMADVYVAQILFTRQLRACIQPNDLVTAGIVIETFTTDLP